MSQGFLLLELPIYRQRSTSSTTKGNECFANTVVIDQTLEKLKDEALSLALIRMAVFGQIREKRGDEKKLTKEDNHRVSIVKTHKFFKIMPKYK